MDSSAIQDARQPDTATHDDKLAEIIVRIAEMRAELQKQISSLEVERSQLKTQQIRTQSAT